MHRAVPDSNILISALVFGGKPLAILEMAMIGELSLVVSEAIVDETLGILKSKFHHSDERLAKDSATIARCTSRVEPTIVLDAVQDDPDDNRILECAVTANAEYIVTGDDDLLRLDVFRGITILTPAQLLDRLNRERNENSET